MFTKQMALNMRTVKSVYRADKVNMGGIIIDQPLPNNHLDRKDPFLLIHHWYNNISGGRMQKELGVGPHPHRGFSPVTIIYKGALHHRDSLGNSSIVEAGGVQWMNAGKGITHSERPSKELAEQGGEFEVIQFWINTPAKHKMEAAKYYPLEKEDIPTVVLDDKGSEMHLIAGEYDAVSGPAKSQSDMLVANLFIKSDSEVRVQTTPDFHTIAYQLNGKTEINDKKIGDKTMVEFSNEGSELVIKSLEDSRILLLSGKPINEPINSYGPFVMNTTTEIMEAIRDAQMGKMGVLIEEFD